MKKRDGGACTPRKGTLSRRGFLRASAAAAAAGAAAALYPLRKAHAQETLVVASWGGFTRASLVERMIPEFEKRHNVKIQLEIANSAPRFAKLRAQKANPQIDVFLATTEMAYRAIKEDLADKIDLDKLPNAKHLYPWARRFAEHGPAYGTHATGIGYHVKNVQTPPTRWEQLWDKKYRGRLALPNITYSSAAYFLIRAAELGGGSIQNIAPGFKKLAELKPAKVFGFFTQWAPLAKSGEFDLVVDLNLFINPQIERGLPLGFVFPEDGAFGEVNYVMMTRPARKRKLAEAFINDLMGARYQTDNARINSQSPTNRNVQISAELAPKLVYGKNLEKTRYFDEVYIAEHRDEWTERFNIEVIPHWK
ncbi:MAG: ABC transporter substrate-binding protein [Candidatus Tectomicrobia bacterium]|nr:ABC transporter substrate-binding protein [Candidatus Tectomicrobia bacterium]